MPSKGPSDKKTPYQGRKRCYGYFRCPDCSHTWESGNSWANIGQECTRCSNDVMVYPYRQKKLEKSVIKSDAHHMEDLCEKCIQLGYCCRELDYDDDDGFKKSGRGRGQQNRRGKKKGR